MDIQNGCKICDLQKGRGAGSFLDFWVGIYLALSGMFCYNWGRIDRFPDRIEVGYYSNKSVLNDAANVFWNSVYKYAQFFWIWFVAAILDPKPKGADFFTSYRLKGFFSFNSDDPVSQYCIFIFRELEPDVCLTQGRDSWLPHFNKLIRQGTLLFQLLCIRSCVRSGCACIVERYLLFHHFPY